MDTLSVNEYTRGIGVQYTGVMEVVPHTHVLRGAPCVRLYPYKPDVAEGEREGFSTFAFLNSRTKVQPSFTGDNATATAIARILKSGKLPTMANSTANSTSRCCLVPTDDIHAHVFVLEQQALRSHGWRLLTLSPENARLLDALGNKQQLVAHAERLGLRSLLPASWNRIDDAVYPCVLKLLGFAGGRGVQIVQSKQQAQRAIGLAGRDAKFLLQELVMGHKEVSTSLVLWKGELKYAVRTGYTYYDPSNPARPYYLWPNVTEDIRARSITDTLPDYEHAQLGRLLNNFTGILNVNYKVDERARRIRVIEVNTRVGGDIAGGTSVQQARVANPGYVRAFQRMQHRFVATTSELCE